MCHHAENKNIALLGVKTIRKVGGLEKKQYLYSRNENYSRFFKSQQRSKLINNHLIKIIYKKKIPIFCNIDDVIGSMRIHSMWR